MSACRVSNCVTRNSIWYTRIPRVYFKFPEFTRTNKFPGISMFYRVVRTLLQCYINQLLTSLLHLPSQLTPEEASHPWQRYNSFIQFSCPLQKFTSQSVTCHPTVVTFPPILQPKLVLDLATSQGRKAELTYCRWWLYCRIVYLAMTVTYLRNN